MITPEDGSGETEGSVAQKLSNSRKLSRESAPSLASSRGPSFISFDARYKMFTPFPPLLRVLSDFHECFDNSIETQKN